MVSNRIRGVSYVLIGLVLLVIPFFLLSSGEYMRPSVLVAGAGSIGLIMIGLFAALNVSSVVSGRQRTTLAGTATFVALLGVIGIFIL